jgi:hypothetical protein
MGLGRVWKMRESEDCILLVHGQVFGYLTLSALNTVFSSNSQPLKVGKPGGLAYFQENLQKSRI